MVVATLMTMVAMSLGLATPASAATALRCEADVGAPEYDSSGSITGWGQISCNKSVAWIDITVYMNRGGIQVFNGTYHATRLSDNQLVNVLTIFSKGCPGPGSYQVFVSGIAAGWPYVGTNSQAVQINC
jgi:hypothetical protein